VADRVPVITACSCNLFHAPYFAMEHGTTPAAERAANPGSDFLSKLPGSLRSFERARDYAPNQAFIGALDPRRLPPRPWHSAQGPAADSEGSFGAILGERTLYALLKFADSFDLVVLEKGFNDEALSLLGADKAMRGADLSRLKNAIGADELAAEIAAGSLPLVSEGRTLGCVRSAHPSDVNLSAHTILENLASKAGAAYALRRLCADNSVDPRSIDYIIETSEEACGDMNQRGGGNFAKSVGELCGLSGATGSDVRSFCAGPVHGLLQAASMIRAGSARTVVVVAGGSTAKLAMNAKKHVEKGLPVLEDCLGSFAILVTGDSAFGLRVRNDLAGMLKIGSGSSPQAVIQDLVADPLARAGLGFGDIDYYAPELQNSEIMEAAGAGNVTLANLKMIAAMAVMKKEIERSGMDAFIAAHGTDGWAPTQGHIPSGIPAIGWFLTWAREGTFKRGLLIGKGSLFLGRMTGLFDGVSLLLETWSGISGKDDADSNKGAATRSPLRIGLTVPGSEGGPEELARGAAIARSLDAALEPVLFGKGGDDAQGAQREMEKALGEGSIAGAVTFHYPFPIGIATVGQATAPGNGRELFIATTTGTASADRVEALVLNAVSGIAAAKAFGIARPSVGFLNLDGAARALSALRELVTAGYDADLASSSRGDALLRGNDILAGSVDVVVCDSLTGNAVIKMLSAFTTGGRIEVTGSGYGPAVGENAPAVGIISRATAAPVVASAMALMARMARADLSGVYARELAKARQAGLRRIVEGLKKRRGGEAAATAPVDGSDSSGGAGPVPGSAHGPERKVVQHEIEGIDVMEIEDAASLLLRENIYCEAGMGCTGPVVLVAEEDAERALGRLRASGLLGGG
jgi:betaine reductase